MLLCMWIGCASSDAPAANPADGRPPEVPTGGCLDDGSTREDAVLYGATTLDLDLTLSADAISHLARTADEAVRDVPASFTYEGTNWNVGLHLRGGAGSFRTFDEKPGFALDFTAADPSARFRGLRALTLKNNVQDDGMLDEHLAYALSTRVGLPAPRHGFARVRVNGEPFGLYALVESVESVEFLDRCFGETGGTLFEGQMDDLEAERVEGFDPVVDGRHDADPRSVLHAVTDALDAAGDDLDAVLDARLDLAQFEALMAVEMVTGNPDGYVAWQNNYYLYAPPGAGRLGVVTWGPDQAFWKHLDPRGAYPARVWNDCEAAPGCAADLRAHIRAVVDVLTSESWRTWVEAEDHRTEADCLSDPRVPGGAEACRSGRARLRAFLDARPDEMEGFLVSSTK